MLNFKNSKTLI